MEPPPLPTPHTVRQIAPRCATRARGLQSRWPSSPTFGSCSARGNCDGYSTCLRRVAATHPPSGESCRAGPSVTVTAPAPPATAPAPLGLPCGRPPDCGLRCPVYACWTYNGNVPGGGPAFACDYAVLCCICLEIAGEDPTKDIMSHDRLTTLAHGCVFGTHTPAAVASGLRLPSSHASMGEPDRGHATVHCVQRPRHRGWQPLSVLHGNGMATLTARDGAYSLTNPGHRPVADASRWGDPRTVRRTGHSRRPIHPAGPRPAAPSCRRTVQNRAPPPRAG